MRRRKGEGRAPPAECSYVGEHTPCPEGYLEWHAWAKKMMKTHRSQKCPGCGLFKIWVLKRRRS